MRTMRGQLQGGNKFKRNVTEVFGLNNWTRILST